MQSILRAMEHIQEAQSCLSAALEEKPETGIDDVRLANEQAEKFKIAERYRKLQRDVSRFIGVLGKITPTPEAELQAVFDEVREGKI